MQRMVKAKKQIMSWDKNYYLESNSLGYSDILEQLFSIPQRELMTSTDMKNSVVFNGKFKTQQISNPQKSKTLLNSVSDQDVVAKEYETKIITFFLKTLEDGIINVRMPGKVLLGDDSLNNLCVYMAMPRLSATNILLTGGPRPRGPGG